MRSKFIKTAAVAAALALVGAACGNDDSDSGSGGDTTQAPATTAAPATTTLAPSASIAPDTTDEETGGVLRYVQSLEPATLNPVKSVVGDAAIWGSMFDRLIGVDDNLGLSDSGLVVAWEAPDDTTWRFTTREGVTFHNGEEWNAEALKFTLDEYRLNTDSLFDGFLSGVTDVVVVDDTTVDVISGAPNGAVPNILATLFGLPPEHYAALGADGFQNEPVGTGPFKLVNIQPGIGVNVEANLDYWQGRPALDGIEFSYAVDEASRVALLESGDVDAIDSVSVRSANRLSGSDDIQIITVASQRGLPLFLVDTKPPLDNPVLREAIALSIDRQAIVDAVFEGTGASPVTGILSPITETVAAPDDLYDPDRARELLASLGDVPAIPFSFQVGRNLGDGDVGEIVAGMLEEVGFTVERNPQEYATLVGAVIAGEVAGMFNTSTFPVYLHPDVFANAFLSPTVSLTKSCKSDPVLDELRTAAVAELDSVAAGEIYSEMDRLVSNEIFCMIPLYVENRSYGLSSDVTGFLVRSDTVPDWYYASL